MFYSQLGQDKYIVEEVFKHRKGLFFVDVGAYDGIKFSNTLYLERQLGWTGVCIEPMHEQFIKLKRERTAACFECCVSDYEGQGQFLQVQGQRDSVSMLSGLSEYINGKSRARIEGLEDPKTLIDVPVRKLSSILKECGRNHVDYLSLDAEGAEEKILNDVFDAGVTVDCISVEQNYGDRRCSSLLAARGFQQLQCFHGYDFLFCRAAFLEGTGNAV